jgi:molecular chaperone GrpE
MSLPENEPKNETQRPEEAAGNEEKLRSEAVPAEGQVPAKSDEEAQKNEYHHDHDPKKGHHKDHHPEHDLHRLEKEIQELREKVSHMEEDNAVLKDGYARKVAEFDNYKRRIARDLESSRLTANRDLILDILPVFDNFSRALSAAEKSKDFNNLYEGLRITHSQIGNLLGKFNVKPIEALGKPFDHNLHEALMMEERDDVEHDTTVTEELEKGYYLGETVLKHSKVKVARKKPK